jgi:glycosyltransferase involved in cell wall biosynthesis
MVAFHQIRGTWRERVDRFITLTGFARDLFIEHAGFPAEKIVVKANVVPDIGVQPGEKPYALFVGRLSPEKGIAAILGAARSGHFPLPLYIVGSGPLEDEVRAAAVPGRVEFLGKKSSAEVHQLLQGAKMLLAPSMWHEAGVPLVIGEAYSAGVPVITCRVQPMESVVLHERNGLLVPLGGETEMSAAICDAAIRLHTDPALAESIGREARATYERLYRPEANFRALTAIYGEAMREAGSHAGQC